MKCKTALHIFLLLTLWVFLFNKLIKKRQMPHCTINLPKTCEGTLEKNKIKLLCLNEEPKWCRE